MSIPKTLAKWMLCLGVLISALADASPLDPCEHENEATDRYACLLELIEAERSAIEARISYLNSTAGPQGAQGPQGEPGEPGDQGPQGEDRETFIVEDIAARQGGMDERYRSFITKFNDNIIPLVNAFQTDIDDLRRDFSDINRNPDIIAESSIDRIRTLDFPTYIGQFNTRNYFTGFDVYRKNGTEFCEVRFEFSKVETNCVPATIPSGSGIVNVCQDSFPGQPDYCGVVLDSETLNSITEDVFFEFDANLDVLLNIPEETPFQIVSADEWSSYKLGMDPDDPVFLMALDYILAQLNDPAILEEVLRGLEASESAAVDAAIAKEAELTALIALNQSLGDPNNVIPELQAAKDAIPDNLLLYQEAYEAGKRLTMSLADGTESYGLKRQRLAEYAMDSDMMYYVVVQSVIEIYLRFLNNPSGLTAAQFAALEEFESRLLLFIQDFIEEWKAEARRQHNLHFQQESEFPLIEAYTLPTTPDFVETARDIVAARYDTQQSPNVVSFGQVAASVGVLGAFPAMFAAGAVGAASISAAITSAGSTVGLGLFSAFGGVGFTALGGLTGVAAIATGPAIAIALAVTGIVVGAIAVDEQLKKDKRYEALQALEIPDMAYFQALQPLLDDQLANWMYMWLMIDNPRGASNNPSY